jgi:hypothetical protein
MVVKPQDCDKHKAKFKQVIESSCQYVDEVLSRNWYEGRGELEVSISFAFNELYPIRKTDVLDRLADIYRVAGWAVDITHDECLVFSARSQMVDGGNLPYWI